MSKRHADHAMLDNAKANKNDEFYTQYADIERELKHYSFHGKVVLCNCDDPRISNFYKYFVDRFDELGIRKLICSCYNSADNDPFDNADGGVGFWYSYDGMGKKIPDLDDCHMFNGDGDFRRGEALDLAREADIVVTNPPFSLFREYVVKMENLGKLFLVIGNINAITYKDIFGLIQNNRAWLGVNLGRGISGFIVPDNYILYGQEARIENGKRIVATNSCLWLTNMDNSCRHAKIPLVKEYKDGYKKYDNYDGINVDKTKGIPYDYPGYIGVPITFLHKFNPDQFEIVKFRKGDDGKDLTIDGKPTYFRIIVRNREVGIKGRVIAKIKPMDSTKKKTKSQKKHWLELQLQ